MSSWLCKSYNQPSYTADKRTDLQLRSYSINIHTCFFWCGNTCECLSLILLILSCSFMSSNLIISGSTWNFIHSYLSFCMCRHVDQGCSGYWQQQRHRSGHRPSALQAVRWRRLHHLQRCVSDSPGNSWTWLMWRPSHVTVVFISRHSPNSEVSQWGPQIFH